MAQSIDTQTDLRSPASSPARPVASLAPDAPRAEDALIEHLIRQRFASTAEYRHTTHRLAGRPGEDLVDVLFATPHDPHEPGETFSKLRWGGQFIFVDRNRDRLFAVARRYSGEGFVLEQPPTLLRKRRWGLFYTGYYYFVARKVLLIRPGESSDRFTYHVELVRARDLALPGDGYVVKKQVPTFERVMTRLRDKFPDTDAETVERRARKFTDKIFPVFLTRETAILRLLQRDLPPPFARRVPEVLLAEQDDQGFVRTLYMNWLRNGVHGPALSQLAFARQAAELLAALHDTARVIHLDLRLDNFVITERGVGFVDFGSAVRVGENLGESPLLSNLFDEMMRTSQIQRMLGRMQEKGLVTSQEITGCHGKVDKAVDFFYLAVQINSPHANPDFRGLVRFDPVSPEARALSTLTEEILRPVDCVDAPFKSAQDILQGIQEIEQRLARPA